MSAKPSISQHLSILETAGLVISGKRGQFVFYRLVPESLTNTLNGFVQEVCPVSRPLSEKALRWQIRLMNERLVLGSGLVPRNDRNWVVDAAKRPVGSRGFTCWCSRVSRAHRVGQRVR